MSNFKNLFGIFFLGLALTILNGCAGFNQTDARKFPPNPELRVKKNIEEGRGFRLDSAIKGNMKGGDFLFASANELWRASLDTIDFMPLSSVNYSGGIPSEPAVLDQQGCIYEPHVFGMMAGQDLLVKNSDATLHNIHSMPKVNKEFNIAMPKVVKE